jgi:type VI protein secretion system component VasK
VFGYDFSALVVVLVVGWGKVLSLDDKSARVIMLALLLMIWLMVMVWLIGAKRIAEAMDSGS